MGFARFHPEIGCCCWGRCFWRHLRLEVFFKRCVPLNLLSVPPSEIYVHIDWLCVFFSFSTRETVAKSVKIRRLCDKYANGMAHVSNLCLF